MHEDDRGAAVTVLPPLAASARRARRFVADTLDDQACAAMADTAMLLTSELVSNVVLHARSDLCLRVLPGADRIRVEVSDGCGALPRCRYQPADALTGRGLMLVDQLAADWGVEREPGGKVVWFELAQDGGG